MCEPIVEGGKPGYRFTATGTFDRLLTGVKIVANESGGGYPKQTPRQPTHPLLSQGYIPNMGPMLNGVGVCAYRAGVITVLRRETKWTEER